MQQHTAELYYCTDCRAVYVGHHNPGDDEDHYTPPEHCGGCDGDGFEPLANA